MAKTNNEPSFAPVDSTSVLTPLQSRALRCLFRDYRELQAFCLTGGTALAGYYVGHRRSIDLDLFTIEPEALTTIPAVMNDFARRQGLVVERVRNFTFMQQFEVRDESNAVPLRIDFVKDIATRFGEVREFDGVRVDNARNIGSNKVCAILGRTDAKDFIDLYFLLQHGFDFDALFAEAQQKHGGLVPFWFATALRQGSALSHLPKMLVRLDIAKLRQFFLDLADRMLALLKPEASLAVDKAAALPAPGP